MKALRYDKAFQEIERVVSLTDGFAVVPVQVDGPDLARELAGHLTAHRHPCVTLEPLDEQGWQGLAVDLSGAKPAAEGAVVVIGRVEVPSTAGGALRLVNQQRDTIAKALTRPLLWCGPASFLALTWERAPDFWSVRLADHKIVADAQETEASEVERLRDLLKEAEVQGDAKNALRLRVRLATRRWRKGS